MLSRLEREGDCKKRAEGGEATIDLSWDLRGEIAVDMLLGGFMLEQELR